MIFEKNIIGISVLSNGALKMSNRNFNYQIEFGSIINVERKFNNYKAFFKNSFR